MLVENRDYFDNFRLLLLQLSTEFINIPLELYDTYIERALQLIGEYVGVDHCYILLFEDDYKHIFIRHEWTASGKVPLQDSYATTLSPWFEAQIKAKCVVPVPNLDNLPPEAEQLRQVLMDAGVKSNIDVPLIVNDHVIGCIGYESTSREYEWTEELVQLLILVGEIYGNAYKRFQAEEARKYYIKFQQVILDLSSEFIDSPDNQIQSAIEKTLQSIGQFVGADRSFIVYVTPDQDNNTQVYEWCAEGIPVATHYRQHIASEPYSSLLQKFQSDGVVHISDVSDLPDDVQYLKNELQLSNIQSFIMISMTYQGRWLGYLGLDSVQNIRTWSTDDITLLKIVSRMITNGLQRQVNTQTVVQMEKLQTALEKEKETTESRNNYISILSHEIRTPLTVINNSAEILLHIEPDLNQDRVHKHLNLIQSQTHHLSAMLDSLSIAIKTENGYLKFAPLPIDIVEFCRQIVDKLQVLTLPNQVLHLAVLTTESTFMGDTILLEHILINLISNAIKYTPDGGSIILEVSNTATSMILRVQDEGIGIDEEEQKQLFKPYFRAKNVGTIRGTGLGLKIVKDCVELHGGTIAVTSQLKQGTTITITLPLEVEDDELITGD